MQIIFLTGKQGALKTSLWGAALQGHFERAGKRVLYVEYRGEDTAEFSRSVREEGPDVVIVDTEVYAFPFIGFIPDFELRVCEFGLASSYETGHSFIPTFGDDGPYTDKRSSADDELINAYLDGRDAVTVEQVSANCLGLPDAARTLRSIRQIERSLVLAGWKRSAPPYSSPMQWVRDTKEPHC
ncbi:hypothetical protein [Paraburkholderia tropica]|uniref:hypothetical protein n=1 Tax=Paraburkholderia tropica TaxID=92647 RepID=UPI00160CB205|nr:hypothetical protein [Paraburkholderia tropica]MBB6319269.1 hypothetical protein [Paraburkholderia tropica]